MVCLSVCLSHSCIVLKRQKISTRFHIRFLLHTLTLCLSRIALKFGLHRSTTFLPKFCAKVTQLPDDLRHPMANCGRMVRDSTIFAMESVRDTTSLFRIVPSLTPYDLAYRQNGGPKCTTRTNFATRGASWRIMIEV